MLGGCDEGAGLIVEDDSVEDRMDAHRGDVRINTRCGTDERVFNGACVPCALGSVNASGDDPMGVDTRWDDVCFDALGVTCDAFEEAYVKASNTGVDDRFGSRVALDGDTLVVGAPDESSDARGVNSDQSSDLGLSSGAVYVFEREDNVWMQQAYIKASNTDAADAFGSFVAIDGDTLVVGAPGEDSLSTGVDGDQGDDARDDSGAVYVVTRSGDGGSTRADLKASGANPGAGPYQHLTPPTQCQ